MRPQDGAGSDRVGDIDAAVQETPGPIHGPSHASLCAVSLRWDSLPIRRSQGPSADALVCLPLTSATLAKLLHDVACDSHSALSSGTSTCWDMSQDLNWRCFCHVIQERASEYLAGPVWRFLSDRLLRIQVTHADVRALEQANACHATFLQHWCEVAPALVGDHPSRSLADQFARALVTIAVPTTGDQWRLEIPTLASLPHEWPTEVPDATRDVLSRVVASFHDRWPDPSAFASGKRLAAGVDQENQWPMTLECLLQRIAKLERLEADFARELEQAKLRAMQELAYGASHEINNPLANISSRAQILLRSETDASRRHALATINRQAFRAHEMIADLMLFAKPPVLDLREIEAGELFESCVAKAHESLVDEYPSLHEIPMDTLWVPLNDLVHADAVHLTVAVKAILANALDCFEGSPGCITIRSSRTLAEGPEGVTWVELSLHDTGPGIDPHVREHLFDPFFSGREAGRGLGFGLSKVWTIMKLHGGRVTVQGDASDGTTVVLSLPVAQPSVL